MEHVASMLEYIWVDTNGNGGTYVSPFHSIFIGVDEIVSVVIVVIMIDPVLIVTLFLEQTTINPLPSGVKKLLAYGCNPSK